MSNQRAGAPITEHVQVLDVVKRKEKSLTQNTQDHPDAAPRSGWPGAWRHVLILIAFAAAFVVGWYWVTFARVLSPESLFAQASPAILHVVIHDREGRVTGKCSGCLVEKRGTQGYWDARDGALRHQPKSVGLIATNYHMVQPAHAAHVVFADKSTLPVLGLAALDKDADLAILMVAGRIDGTPLELGDDLPPVGMKVFAIDNPLGLTSTMSEGLVSHCRCWRKQLAHGDKGELVTEILTTADAGSTGGALLSIHGKLLGVMKTSSLPDQERKPVSPPPPLSDDDLFIRAFGQQAAEGMRESRRREDEQARQERQAQQYDARGRKYLNIAVSASDITRLLRRCDGELRQFPLTSHSKLVADQGHP